MLLEFKQSSVAACNNGFSDENESDDEGLKFIIIHL